MAEYAQTYGHLPKPDDSWHLFLALAARGSVFWARRQLINYDAVVDGVNTLFDDSPAVGDGVREELERKAYPVGLKKRRPTVIQNAWAPDTEEDGSDG